MKSAISILQMQARNATADIQSLQAIKERAIRDPEEFSRAIAAGDIKGKGDSLFNPLQDDEDMDDEEDEGIQGEQMGKEGKI